MRRNLLVRHVVTMAAMFAVVLTVSTPPVASATVQPTDWFKSGTNLCLSKPGSALAADMKQSVARSKQVPTYPIAMSADGSRMFVSTYSRDFSGVAELAVASGKLIPIHAFAHPDRYGASGSFDGRFLVWVETHSFYDLGTDSTAYSYDTRMDVLRTFPQTIITDAQGNKYSSSWQFPAANSGFAAAIGAVSRGPQQIVGIELSNGVERILHRGRAGFPIMIGTTAIWPEWARLGAKPTLGAADVRTGRAVKLPSVLRGVHGTVILASDGTRFVYTDPSSHELFYSPTPSTRARSVIRLKGLEQFQNVGMAEHTLVWTTTEATYVADTRTGRYSRLVTSGGWVASSGALAIVEPSSAKTNHPLDVAHLLRVSDIDFQPCR